MAERGQRVVSARHVSLALVGLGLATVAAGFVIPLTAGASSYLSESEAQEYLDSAVALHGQTMPEPGESVSAESIELTKARRRYLDARARVDAARQTRDWLPTGLKLAGALMAVVGLVGARVRS